MYKTETEIFSQFDALKLTLSELARKKNDITAFFNDRRHDSVTFIGSGSSYCIAKSAARMMRLYNGVPSYAVSAGDLFINFDYYKKSLGRTVVVSLSRSGSTSEVVYCIDKIRGLSDNIPYVSICEKVKSPLSAAADFNIELPWAFDESVCQTRSVTNMYAACALITAYLANDSELYAAFTDMIDTGNTFIKKIRSDMERAATANWEKAVVIADGPLAGIAEEAALAFKEICMTPSNYYNFLDVRHGPMVLIDDRTLVLAALSPAESIYQHKLIADITQKKAAVVALCGAGNRCQNAGYIIDAPTEEFISLGVPLAVLAQLLAFYKALRTGINPDEPSGLDPWIAL